MGDVILNDTIDYREDEDGAYAKVKIEGFRDVEAAKAFVEELKNFVLEKSPQGTLD